ncbi:DNA-binding protein [Halomonas vilamensis]|uniref:DNA-binding protein n=1 Tax=Vreelandella vilamensis TaxID=531309 RepID=A0ABU1H1T6_9GAMM|nr:DNA-binding protein [Halomonas vilamensis]MDR5898282.1 DNA-binding protein [Halomonas vilamensis]
MARNGIQYSDVQHAIDQLISRGDTPSVQRIREVLGTGSFTTISEHFRHWRSERAQNRDIPPPKGVPEVIVTLASDMWQQAQEVANEGLAHYREEADRKVADAQTQAKDAQTHAANAAQRESALAEHLRHIEARLESLSGDLAEATTQCARWKAENEHHEQQLKAANSQLEALAQQRNEQEEQSRITLVQQRQAWEEKLVQEQQRNEATEGKLMGLLDSVRQEYAEEEKALNKRLQQLEKRLEALGDSVKDEQKTRHQAETRQKAAEQRLAQEKQTTQQHEEETKRLQSELDSVRQTLNKTQREHETLTKRQSEQWQNELWQSVQALQRQVSSLPDSLRAQVRREDKNENAPR